MHYADDSTFLNTQSSFNALTFNNKTLTSGANYRFKNNGSVLNEVKAKQLLSSVRPLPENYMIDEVHSAPLSFSQTI